MLSLISTLFLFVNEVRDDSSYLRWNAICRFHLLSVALDLSAPLALLQPNLFALGPNSSYAAQFRSTVRNSGGSNETGDSDKSGEFVNSCCHQ